jgi:hypothetical protein
VSGFGWRESLRGGDWLGRNRVGVDERYTQPDDRGVRILRGLRTRVGGDEQFNLYVMAMDRIYGRLGGGVDDYSATLLGGIRVSREDGEVSRGMDV